MRNARAAPGPDRVRNHGRNIMLMRTVIAVPYYNSNISNQIGVYGPVTDGQMVLKAFDGANWQPSGSDLFPLGGNFISVPAIYSSPDQLVQTEVLAFGIGTNNQAYW